MFTDAEIVRLHSQLRKEAFDGLNAQNILEQLRTHGPVLTGFGVGALTGPEDAKFQAAMAGGLGGTFGGYTGAFVTPAAYSLYHHLSAPEPQNAHPYAG